MAAAKCPASPALQRKLTAALGACTACAPQVEYFEGLAATCPEIEMNVAELRVMLDHIEKLSKKGLEGTIANGGGDTSNGG